MNKIKFFAWTGIVLAVVNLTAYFIFEFSFVVWMILFAIIYIVFVLGLKWMKKKSM